MGFFKKLGKGSAKTENTASVNESVPSASNTTVTAVDRLNEKKAAEPPLNPDEQKLKKRKKLIEDLKWEAEKIDCPEISAVEHTFSDFLDWYEDEMESFIGETVDEMIEIDKVLAQVYVKLDKLADNYKDRSERVIPEVEKFKKWIAENIIEGN